LGHTAQSSILGFSMSQTRDDSNDLALFAPWLTRWNLVPDGEVIVGTWAKVMPVRCNGEPAMLKAGLTDSEASALDLLSWYEGQGAVRLLERGDTAVLMERAVGQRSLAAMARGGDDERALRVLCDTATRLHAERAIPPPPSLLPLARRFERLEPASAAVGGVLARAWDEAKLFLATAHEERPLHGDLWHDNVRDGGVRGWLAIDPKGFLGERTYDFAIMVGTPDFPDIAAELERLRRRARFVADVAELDYSRLLSTVLIDAGLYAVWSMSEAQPDRALAVAEIAAAAVSA
jgi:streptomycin 6-kinase